MYRNEFVIKFDRINSDIERFNKVRYIFNNIYPILIKHMKSLMCIPIGLYFNEPVIHGICCHMAANFGNIIDSIGKIIPYDEFPDIYDEIDKCDKLIIDIINMIDIETFIKLMTACKTNNNTKTIIRLFELVKTTYYSLYDKMKEFDQIFEKYLIKLHENDDPIILLI